MHPDAQEASKWIEEYRIIPNIDPRGKERADIVEIARWLQDIYHVRVVEVLNRRRDGVAIEVMADLRDVGVLPLLGTGVKAEHVREAIARGAVGYVSPGKNARAIHAAIAEPTDGARLAIPTVSTSGDYYDVLENKMDAFGVQYASQLPHELWWNKVFPGTPQNLIQPDEEKEEEANAYLRRMLGPATEEELNFHMLVTGHDRAEQAIPYLQIQKVGGKSLITATGPALENPKTAYPWFEAVEQSQPYSPWKEILLNARKQVRNVTRLHSIGKKLHRTQRGAPSHLTPPPRAKDISPQRTKSKRPRIVPR